MKRLAHLIKAFAELIFLIVSLPFRLLIAPIVWGMHGGEWYHDALGILYTIALVIGVAMGLVSWVNGGHNCTATQTGFIRNGTDDQVNDFFVSKTICTQWKEDRPHTLP